ncbi:MAG: insulinase family protein, partial [Pseudomonadota bacterium]|nr:insulinase family protein [Pseudomonadota bacterium]
LNWRSDTLSPRVEVRYQIPGVGHPDRPAFDVLGEAFEVYLQSEANKAGVGGKIDINTRVVHTSRFGVPASINVELVVSDAGQLEDAERVLLGGIARLREAPLLAADLAFAKKKLRSDWYRTANDPSNLAFEIGHFEVMDGWRALVPYLEARDAATAADLQRLAARYFITNNRSIGVVMPEETP